MQTCTSIRFYKLAVRGCLLLADGLLNRKLLISILLLSPPSFAQPAFFSPECEDGERLVRYSSAMLATNEPSLLQKSLTSVSAQAYRLTIRTPFDYNVRIIIRAEIDATAGSRIISHDMKDGREPVSVSSVLGAKEIKQLEIAYAAADFRPVTYPKIEQQQSADFLQWTRPPRKEAQTVIIGVRDGDLWLFEAVEGGKYKCVEGPAAYTGTYHALGALLSKLAGKAEFVLAPQ